MEQSIPYSSIQDINTISRWDAGHKFCLRITIADGSVLLQVCMKELLHAWTDACMELMNEEWMSEWVRGLQGVQVGRNGRNGWEKRWMDERIEMI